MSRLSSGPGALPLEDSEAGRFGLYRLLGVALSHPPTPQLLDALRILPTTDDSSLIGVALANLARSGRAIALEQAKRDYATVFVGVARGELVPYASFYLTGFLHDRPLARLREDLVRLGLEAAPSHPDPEDHAGTLCELMAGFIDGAHGATLPLDRQRDFFRRHLAPWIGNFFADLSALHYAALYRAIGALGLAFIDVELHAFEMEIS